MNLRQFAFFFFVLLPVAAGYSQSPKPANPYRVRITPDRTDAMYETGETVTFRILAQDVNDGNRPLDYGSIEFSVIDGLKVLESDTLGVTGQPIHVTAESTRPGFIRCEASFIGPSQKSSLNRAVVAISPEGISPSREFPVDFEAFWTEQKNRLAETALDFTLTPHDSENKELETFDTTVSCGDLARNVSGYFSRPKSAAPKSLPIVLWVHGAGVRSALASQAEIGAENGFLSMDINAHGIENGKPAEFYSYLAKDGFLKAYPTQGSQNRDGFYFRGMFLRLVRAIDFLTAQPEWDGKTIAVVGHSQGGAQAIVAGGLDERVTFVGAGVPAMCDHTGMLRKRLPGWPRMIPVSTDTGKPNPEIAEVSRYFDAVNFASRYHGEAILSVGFLDMVCPPSSVYAAYNALRGEKRMINEPTMGHAATAPIKADFLEAMKNHAARETGSE